MPFLYFFENARSIVGVPEKFRIEYALDVKERSTWDGAGPKGKGLFVSPRADPEKITGYDAAKQTWIPATASGCAEGAWVGIENDNPPKPEDLGRLEMVDGYLVPLADGQKWLVPTAREFPKAITFAPDGGVIETPMDRFKALCQKVDRIWQAQRTQFGFLDEGEEPVEMLVTESADLAMQILGINYRIKKAEASLLKILNNKTIAEILREFADWAVFAEVNKARFEAAVKKNKGGKDPESADTPAGDDSKVGDAD